MTLPLQAVLAQALRDGSPDTVVLMRLFGEAASEGDARAALSKAEAACTTAEEHSRLDCLKQLWAAHPQAWTVVRGTLAGISHDRQGFDPDAVLRYWADAFDRLAAASPEASVALYSLGSAELLDAATTEIVALLDSLGLLGPNIEALDLGCGIGRLLVALSPHVRSIRGNDIAARMVAEARRRCHGLPNVTVVQSDGRDLAGIADRSLDVVIAADVFPYLVQAGGGLAEAHIVAFARVLRPGGAALILNYSYRGDVAADRRDIAAACGAVGLAVERCGTRDLAQWDAASFLLRQPAASPTSGQSVQTSRRSGSQT